VITLYIFRISKHPDRPSYINTLSEIFCLGISHFSPTLSSDFLLSYLPFLFTLFHLSHFSFHLPCSSIFLPSLLSIIAPLSFSSLFLLPPPLPSCSPSPIPVPRCRIGVKFPPCGCVLLTSHLLWWELHICEWMTGKINNPALPFSLTVGLCNE